MTIHYSADGKLYYISGGTERPSMWLTVIPVDGPVPDEAKNPNGLFGPFPAQINHKDGRIWHRFSHPFNAWKVPSGSVQEADKTSDLVLDFASISGWKSL